MRSRLTDVEFKRRLFEKYGESIISTDAYAGINTKIGFKCGVPHTFRTTPHGILNDKVKTGCPVCGRLSARGSLRNTDEDVISQVKAMHGDSFILVGEYKGRKDRTDWECIKGHKFQSSLDNIMLLPGCKRCAGKVNTHEEYLEELQARFGGRIRPLERYRSSHAKILHGCSSDHQFMARPNDVLTSSMGACSACSRNKRRTNEEYDKELEAIHHGLVFRVGDYSGSNTPILHGCGLCGREYPATPGAVLHRKSGCKECAEYGFKMTKPAVMYYLRIIEKSTGDHYFKIGITNRTAESRISQMLRSCVTIGILSVQAFATGEQAFKAEQRILNNFSQYRVPKFNLLKNGNSEVFSRDIAEHLSRYCTV